MTLTLTPEQFAKYWLFIRAWVPKGERAAVLHDIAYGKPVTIDIRQPVSNANIEL